MPPGKTLQRRVGGLIARGPRGIHLLAAFAVLGAIFPISAWASSVQRPGFGVLSPRLAELSKPSVRSLPPSDQARALGLAPAGAGSLLREGSRVLATVRFESGASAAVDGLRAVGAKAVNVSSRYQAVTVAASPAELHRLSNVPQVAGVTEALAPVVYASEGTSPVTAAVTPCFGAATSEGDEQLRAAEARELFAVDGSGVTVGILSDSFNRDGAAPTDAGADVQSGDLPGPGNPCGREAGVAVLDDSETDGEDEGRAMAQIVNDLAPGADLAFATAFTPDVFGFADNVRKLAKPVSSGGADADVIVDDVLYFEEPFFQEGPVGVAVREVTEEGVAYFSSAGNNNLRKAGRDIASWEAPAFRNTGSCPSGLPAWAKQCMDFNPGAPADPTFGVTVEAGETLRVDLQWAQPWQGVTTDLDAYLLNASGNLLDAQENFNVSLTQTPFEFLAWTNSTAADQTVRIAINRCDSVCGGPTGGDASSPRLKLVLMQNGGGVTATEYEESIAGDVIGPTIFGHNGAEDAISTGAIPFFTTAAPEPFSSRGPVAHYFGPVEGVAPAPPLGVPKILAKPDLVATDGGANTFFGSCFSDAWRFFGTSAAAPHAAAVAALQRDAVPAATPAQVKQAQRESAAAVGTFPPSAVGAGILDAVGAIEALGVPPSSPALPVSPPTPVSCADGPGSEPEPEPQPNPTPPPTTPTPSPGLQAPDSRDTAAPETLLSQRPAKVLRTDGRTARATFKFGSDEADVSFLCKFDRKAFRLCLRKTARSFPLGRHVLRVKARDAAGNTDSTPAIYRFRVQRIK
jgi:hypothetical protein